MDVEPVLEAHKKTAIGAGAYIAILKDRVDELEGELKAALSDRIPNLGCDCERLRAENEDLKKELGKWVVQFGKPTSPGAHLWRDQERKITDLTAENERLKKEIETLKHNARWGN
jgi:FtsZ-binding cell division protein ZapB